MVVQHHLPTAFDSSPYQMIYGVKPTHLSWQNRAHTNIDSLKNMLEDRKQQWNLLKLLLELAQARMKSYADKKRSQRKFQMGDFENLKLQPYRQVTVAIRKNLKLSKVLWPLQGVGKSCSLQLALPETSRVHPVFHVSHLKKALAKLWFTGNFPKGQSISLYN